MEQNLVKVNLEASSLARKILDGDAYKLWSYLSSFPEGQTVFFAQESGLGKGTYEEAINELIEKRYLIEKDGKLEFYEIPIM